MRYVEYNCLVCGGLVSTDPDSPLQCICDHPTPPPLQSAGELSGNGAGLGAESTVQFIDTEEGE